ncbi:hypothetical protein M758_8G168100 [Ceratodon purpureus]|uniref:Uncharacterized protein n=1 Tax=Ceratodon purpureus TaxID=3225 RepID=A0A8T0H346_CERPU|nr:hypothetical protein KC19_8G173300 [Ceratodon purpureus]KAG0609225.1 hypothetical protein M758_8G168100 [Ceratodon purpureus]
MGGQLGLFILICELAFWQSCSSIGVLVRVSSVFLRFGSLWERREMVVLRV